MTSVIIGNGLGLQDGSLSQLNGFGSAGRAAVGLQARETAYVNAATGNLVLQGQDDFIAAIGADDSVVRTYNSGGMFDGDNLDGWRMGVYRSLNVTVLTGLLSLPINRTGADGNVATFTYDAVRSAWVSSVGSGSADTIVANGTFWEYREGGSGLVETYDDTGKLLSVRDADGNTRTYGYTGSLVTSITDASGQTTFLEYVGNNLAGVRVTRLRPGATSSSDTISVTRVSYSYDELNRLREVTVDLTPENGADSKVFTTTYGYNGLSKLVSSVVQSDGSSLSIQYDNPLIASKVSSITDGEGRTTTFTYDVLGRQTTVTDALGRASTYLYDASNRLISVTLPSVDGASAQISYVYDDRGNVTQVTDQLGRVAAYQYDLQDNLVLSRDAQGNTVSREYDQRDLMVAQTVFRQADPDGAGPQLAAGGEKSRFVYDSERHLRFVISAEGRVSEYRYQASGEKIREIQYTDALYSAPESNEADLAIWASQRDQTKVQLSESAYDLSGQVRSVTAYRAVDASGQGISDGTESVTRSVFDTQGRLLVVIDPRASSSTAGSPFVTSYLYDGLDRQIQLTDGAGRVTLTNYDDQGRKTIVTAAHGLVTTRLYNNAGDTLSVNQSGPSNEALGQTAYSYDGKGRLRMTTDPTGAKKHYLYDERDRLVATISPENELMETVYNAGNEVARQIRWSGKVTAALTDANGAPLSVTLSGIRPSENPASDRISANYFDLAGRLQYSLDSARYLTSYVYDGAGRVVMQTRYATQLSNTPAGSAAQGFSLPATNAAEDRRVWNIYDQDGRQRATVDGEGALREARYDGAGRLVKTIRYTNPVVYTGVEPLADLIAVATNASSDQVETTVYNSKGQMAAWINADARLTTYGYDLSGNKIRETRYANQVVYTGAESITALITVASANPPAGTPASREKVWTYDSLNRSYQETNEEGVTTRYNYDAFSGFLTSTTRAIGTSQARTTTSRYDALGRLTQQIMGKGSAALEAAGGNATQQEAAWAAFRTQKFYDLAGRLTRTIDPNGNPNFFYYDRQDRLRYAVNGKGEVKSYKYSEGLGDLEAVVEYAQRLDISTLSGGSDSTLTAQLTPSFLSDSKNRVVTTSYDLRGQAFVVTDPLQTIQVSVYNAFGELTLKGYDLAATSLESIRVDRSTYDRRGLMKAFTADVDGLNYVSSNSYDSFGRLTARTDPKGGVWMTEYDRLGRTVTTRDALGQIASMSYDAYDRVLTKTDRLGNVTKYAYDDVNRSVTVTTPEGIVTESRRNEHGQQISITLQNRGVAETTTYDYDKDGQLEKVSKPNTGPSNSESTTTIFDNGGRVVANIDGRGTRTQYSYDAASRVLSRTVDFGAGIDPSTGKPYLNLTTSYEYDSFGAAIRVRDARNIVTETVFDAKGQTVAVITDTEGLKLATVFKYDGRGKTRSVAEGVNAVGSSGSANVPGSWDVTGPALRTTEYVYDKIGRRTEEKVDPAGLALTTNYTYDANDNLVSKIDGNRNLWRYIYDANNRQRFEIDPEGGVKEQVYNTEGLVTKTISYLNRINPAQLSDTSTPQSVASLLVPAAGADRASRIAYDKDGRRAYEVDALGFVTGYQFDAANRIVTKTRYGNGINLASYADSATAAAVTLLLSPSTVADQTTSSVYDAAGREIYRVDALNNLIQNNYDASGNLTSVRKFARPLPAGTSIDRVSLTGLLGNQADNSADRLTLYLYDGASRMRYETRVRSITVTEGQSQYNAYIFENRYDNLGRVIETFRYATALNMSANSVTAATVAANIAGQLDPLRDQKVTRTYDGAGRLFRETDAEGFSETYGYDRIGNKTSFINKNNETWLYRYDGAGRLIEEKSPLTTIYIQPNTPAASAPASLSGSVTKTFVYDGLGNIKNLAEGYTPAGGTFVSSRVTQYGYDLLGRQNATIFPNASVYNPTADAAAGFIGVHENSQNPDSSTLFDALGNAVASKNVGGVYSYKIYDLLGRVRYEIDADRYVTGYEYDAFGNLAATVRYANALTSSHVQGQAYTTQELLTALNTQARDRRIVSNFDALNRKIATIQSAVFSYDSSSAAPVAYSSTISPTTVFEYNAFGDMVKESRLRNGILNTFDSAYSYFDQIGDMVASIDANGYLTQMQYSAAGKVVNRKEWSTALAPGSWNVTGYLAPTQVAASVGGTSLSTLYSSNFASGSTAGLSGTFGSNFNVQGGNFVIRNTYSQAAAATVIVDGTTSYNGSDTQKTTFSFDFSMGSNGATTANRYLGIGNLSNSSGQTASSFGVYLWLSPTAASIYNVDGTKAFAGPSLSLPAGIAYRMDIVSDARGATVYIYQRTLTRGTGVEYRFDTSAVPSNYRVQAIASRVTTANTSEAPLNVSQISVATGNESTVSASQLSARAVSNVRETSYGYDRQDREITRTAVGVINTTVNAVDGRVVTSVGNQITRQVQYDGLGNESAVIDAGNARTLNFYDAVGRLVAVTGPAVSSTPIPGAAASVYSSLTAYRYDSTGNLLLQTQFAYGTNRTLKQSGAADLPTPIQVSATYDVSTYNYYDKLGRLLRSFDALGNETAYSYDAFGNLVKSEQNFARSNGYALGRKVQVSKFNGRGLMVEQADRLESGAMAIKTTGYNAFGEIESKGLAGGDQPALVGTAEVYRYDNNGNLVFANRDGAGTVYLNDLQGNATAQLTSPTLNLSSYTSAAAAALTANVRRTETVYDASSRVVQQRLPTLTTAPFATTIVFGKLYSPADNKPFIFLLKPDTPVGSTATLRIARVGTSNWTTFTAAAPSSVEPTPGMTIDLTGFQAGEYKYEYSVSFPGQEAPILVASGLDVFAMPGMVGYVPANSVSMTVQTINGLQYYVFRPIAGSSISLSGMTAVELAGLDGWATYSVTNAGDGSYRLQVPLTGFNVLLFRPVGISVNQDFSNINLSGATAATANAQAVSVLTGLLKGKLSMASLGALASQMLIASFEYKSVGTDADQPYTSIPLTGAGAYTIGNILVDRNYLPNVGHFDFRVTFKTSSGSPINLSTISFNGQPLGTAGGVVTGTYLYQRSGEVDLAPTNLGTGVSAVPMQFQQLDRWGNVVATVNPEGVATNYRYDEFDRVIRQTGTAFSTVTNAGQSYMATPVWQTAYDALGRVIASVDANGNLSSSQYDQSGRLTSQTDGSRATVRYSYNTFGSQVTKTNELNAVTTFSYDRLGRLISQKDPAKATATTFSYDALGNRVGDNRSGVSTVYDSFGNVLQELMPATDATRQQKVTYTYNSLGQKILQVDGNNNSLSWTYDYFGRLITSKGLGSTAAPGAVTDYSYDLSGAKIREKMIKNGEVFERFFRYYDNGLLKTIYDPGKFETSAFGSFREFRRSDYAYDKAGRLVRQRFSALANQNGPGQITYQDSIYQYDSNGRLSKVVDPKVHLSYQYDAQGNKKFVNATYVDLKYQVNNAATTVHAQHYLYDYDGNNRVKNSVDAEVSVSGVTVTTKNTKGIFFQFDSAGNRVGEITYGYPTASSVAPSGYNSFNALRYVVQPAFQKQLTIYSYDTDNRLRQAYDGLAGTITSQRIYNDKNQVSQYIAGSKTDTYTYNPDGTIKRQQSGSNVSDYVYDNAGNVTTLTLSGGATGVYTYDYRLGIAGGYLQKTITATANGQTTTNARQFDFRDNFIGFPVNNDGVVLTKRKDNANSFLIYYGRELLGDWTYTTNSSGPPSYEANFGFNFDPISNQYPSISPGTYVVNAGDTLRSIAQVVYGDANLWYVIADANSIFNDTDLSQGIILKLPNTVVASRNSSTTFRPYSTADIVNDITPPLPAPPPPPKKKCGGFLQALVIVVAVAATVYTAGAASYAIYGAIGTTATTATAGTAIAVGAAAGATAAAAGSVASQLVANAVGLQSGFSFSAVGKAAIGGAIGGAVTAGMGRVGWGDVSWAKVGRASLSNALNQALSIAVGQQDGFSWSSVAASAVSSSVIGNRIGIPILDNLSGNSGGFSRDFFGSAASQLVNRSVQIALSGKGKIDFLSIAADSFGNALGNSIVRSIRANDAEKQARANSRFNLGASYQASLGGLGGYDLSGTGTDGGLFAGSVRGSSAFTSESYEVAGGGSGLGLRDGIGITTYGLGESPDGAPTPIAPADTPEQRAYDAERADYLARIGAYRTDAATSAFASRNESLETGNKSTTAFFDQLRGTVGGDLFANAGNLLSNSGTNLLQSGNAVISLVSDASFRQQALQGIGYALSRPGEIYDGAVDSMSRFYEKPLSEQATAFGQGGLDFLTGLGVGEAAKLSGQGFVAASRYAAENFSLSGASRAVGDFLLDETGALTLTNTVPRSTRLAFTDNGYLDPRTNTFRAATLNDPITVDHIYPTARRQQLDGFEDLSRLQKLNILQDNIGIGNFQPLPQSLNSSKGSLLDFNTFRGAPINPTYAANLARLQEALEVKLQRQINIYQKFNAGSGQ